MPRPSAVVFALLASAQLTVAQWDIVSGPSEKGPGPAEHRHLEAQNRSNGQRASLDLCTFMAKEATLCIIDDGDVSLAEVMQRGNLLAGVNGGYFDENFQPIGLRVIDGKVTMPLRRARLLTGVLCASARGVEIVRVGEFSARRKLDGALECGPFLVDLALPVRALDRTRSARRTFAFTMRGGLAGLGVSSELTLAQLAELLSSAPEGLRLWRAMNLDGGSSTAFWFRRISGDAYSIPEEKRVRDFVGVVSR